MTMRWTCGDKECPNKWDMTAAICDALGLDDKSVTYLKLELRPELDIPVIAHVHILLDGERATKVIGLVKGAQKEICDTKHITLANTEQYSTPPQ